MPVQDLLIFETTDNISKIGIVDWRFNRQNSCFEFQSKNAGIITCDPITKENGKLKSTKKIFQNIIDTLVNDLGLDTVNKDSIERIDAAKEELETQIEENFNVVSKGTGNGNDSDNKNSKKKDEYKPSPAEERDNNAKEQYRNEVAILRQEFRDSKLSYEGWQKLVASKYQTLKDITSTTFPDAWEILEFSLSVKCVLNINDNDLPFMGVILAVPSSFKTAILELLRQHDQTYYSDQFTPAALVGNSTTKTEEELQRSDMLPKMKDNLLVTPELAPLFTANEDDLKATIGKIIRLLDGKGFTGDTGAHGQRGYGETMFSWIGAGVEIPDLVWRLFGILGFKIYFQRPKVTEVTEEDLINDSINSDYKDKINNVKIALFDYLKTFDAAPDCDNITRSDKGRVFVKYNKSADNNQLISHGYIAKLAMLLRHLRGTITIYTNKKNNEPNEDDKLDFRADRPILEQPWRANTILKKLAIAHAISQGRDYFDIRDMPLVFNVALSSTMTQRASLFQALIDNGGSITTVQVMSRLNFSSPTARLYMRTFEAVGLVTSSGGTTNVPLKITLKPKFNWFLSDEYRNIVNGEAANNEKEDYSDTTKEESNTEDEDQQLGASVESFPTLGGRKNNFEENLTILSNQAANTISNEHVDSPNPHGNGEGVNTRQVYSGPVRAAKAPLLVNENKKISPALGRKTFNEHPQDCTSTVNLPSELQNVRFAVFDTEWSMKPDNDGRRQILSIGIMDNDGNKIVKDITDFRDIPPNPPDVPGNPAEKQLLEWFITDVYDKYDTLIGYASAEVKNPKTGAGINSDLVVLSEALAAYKLVPIIDFQYEHGEYRPYILDKMHIDQYRIYKQEIVNGIFGGVYNGNGLGDVVEGILSKEKFDRLEGDEIDNMTPEQRIMYVMQDAELTHELLTHDNFKIITIMSAIANIVKLPLVDVCHSTISNWWTSRVKTEGFDDELKPFTIPKKDYPGARVLEPIVGIYRNPVYLFDVSSLYPTMMRIYNISPETVNCSCCEDNPEAQVPEEVMDIINRWLVSPLNKMKYSDETKRPFTYWICKKRKGIVPQLIESLIELKRQYKEEGNDAMEYAVKILINGFYGLFGDEYFRYSNYIVSELTTSFGKITLGRMESLAKEHGLKVIYGDTDSLFLTDARDEEHINQFKQSWAQLYSNIEISSDAYRLFMLLDSKNYIAYPKYPTKKNPNLKPIVKGVSGKKSNQPKWVNQIQKTIVDNLEHPRELMQMLQKEYADLVAGRIDPKLLRRKIELGMNPEDYGNDLVQKAVGLAQGKRKGETIWYYNIDKGKGKVKKQEWDLLSDSEKTKRFQNVELICKSKYIKDLKITFDKQLKYLGIDFDKDIVGKN